ncbi:hypothetical protein ACFE04_013830 [Oxalis oulophora]
MDFTHYSTSTTLSSNSKLNFSTMKIFNRFRKLFMRFMFSIPSSSSSSSSRHRNDNYNCERYDDAPKTSCSSSYYSSHSHYDEAISDCIEFFNKSSQEDVILDGRKSDVWV